MQRLKIWIYNGKSDGWSPSDSSELFYAIVSNGLSPLHNLIPNNSGVDYSR